jgi:hypothetical protein
MGDLSGAEAACQEAGRRFDSCGSGWGVFSRLNLGLARAEADKHVEALQTWSQVRTELAGAGQRGVSTALHVFHLASLASLNRWAEFEQELDHAETALAQTGMVDLDIALFARRAALACESSGKAELAGRAWVIAHGQWLAMGRVEEAAEAESRKTGAVGQG